MERDQRSVNAVDPESAMGMLDTRLWTSPRWPRFFFRMMLPRWRRSRRTCKTVLAASWHCAYITLCWLGQDGGEVLVGLNPAQGFNGSNNSELWRIHWIMVPDTF